MSGFSRQTCLSSSQGWDPTIQTRIITFHNKNEERTDMTLSSTCCEAGGWHPHTKCEWHRQMEDYHLVAWDLREGVVKVDSCGWAVYCGRMFFEGRALDLEHAKVRAEDAVEHHEALMLELRCLGLTRTGWEGT